MNSTATAQAVPAYAPNPPYVEATLMPNQDPLMMGSGGLPPPPSNPSAPPHFVSDGSNRSSSVPQYNEAGAREYLAGQKWPIGLQDTFVQNLSKIPMRFFICDDSGSMIASDGHKLMDSPQGKKMISCTRWDELTASLKFHAGIARAAGAPTEFRLLNGSAPIRLGFNDEMEATRFETLNAVLNESPGGATPLCHHIREVIAQIRPMEAQLRANGQKVCVMIASDGESSDGDIVSAMQPLRQLPVWVVIRLCTDEDRIVDYWNNIDNQLELDMDVLDDLTGEAQEVYTANPWLTYGEALHRLREFGIPVKETDLIDETLLSLDQIRRFCCIIFGGRMDDYPHPELDWHGFIAAVERQNSRTSAVWNPVTKRMTRWVSMSKLRRLRKGGGCSIS